jgi:hypothetical protein
MNMKMAVMSRVKRILLAMNLKTKKRIKLNMMVTMGMTTKE